jgi:glycosyltransferase involved in cell wall biosynthesis
MADCDFPLIRELQNQGHDVTYLIWLSPHSLKSTLVNIDEQKPENSILPASEYKEFLEYADCIDLSKCYVANCPAFHQYSWKYIIMTFKIISFIKRGHFDVIHSDIFPSLTQFPLYLTEHDKWFLTVHDPFPHSGESGKLKSIQRKIGMCLVKRFFLLNNLQLEKFCEYYKVNEENVRINKLGIYSIMQKYSCKNTEPTCDYALFFGRISPYKGVDDLCKAVSIANESGSKVKLHIAGSGSFNFEISQYTQDGNITIENAFIDIRRLAELIYNSKFVVCPYKDATQSGVIMTCYALNKPVIVTNVGGLAEMVDDQQSGIVVPPRDVQALSRAITSLYSDNDKLHKMERFIQDEYINGPRSWKAIAEKYVDFYTSIL